MAPDEIDPELERRLEEWSDREASGESLEFDKRLERELFSESAPGTIFPQVIEFDHSFASMRPFGWHEREAGIRVVERLSLPKIGPHQYLWQQATNIQVWVDDDAVRQALLDRKSNFKQLDWQEPTP